ncbi:ABC transporter permease [Verminephrobacter eiseniae]|uniref:ABC transporter permease n=1 Tax=Verminephrobacter eiseniae TaxID=364317 RepID=UPI002238AB8E|nr:ABC transporter permease [Verminephrobacter eiseniae]MCW5236659.1 ABC transporter permease [Verminephrobacter eiseniae]
MRHTAHLLLTLLGVSLVVFVLIRVVPGDPVAMMIPPGAGSGDIARLRAFYGLERSIPEQYGLWLVRAVQGEFGTSISLRQDVLRLIGQRLPATLELGLTALVFAVLAGGLAGIVSAAAHGRWAAALIDGAAALVQAVPDFLWGLVFILLFGVVWMWLPISGRVDPLLQFSAASGFIFFESLLRGRWDVTASVFQHSVAPALALALPVAAIIARVLKASMCEALAADYVLLARLKGLSLPRVLLTEALPNALTPALQITGVQFAFLLGGTVLIERLFSYPGIGSLAINAVIARDLPLIQGVVLTFAVLFIAINLGVDALTLALNPRLRGVRR